MGFLKKLFGRQEPEAVSTENDKPEEPRGPVMADKGTDADPSLPDEGPHRRSWIGVDLDGTLAKYDGWRGFDHIGEPIEGMRQRVEEWMEQGYTVKIFTARASEPDRGIPPVKTWLKEHGMPDFEVTCSKDFDMIEVWDDRAVQVVSNSGSPVLSPRFGALPRAPLFGIEHRGKKADEAG